MAQLEYSIEAVNVLKKFYRAEALVYVEGDDDIPFWTAVFSAAKGVSVAVECAGGVEEAEKFVRRIEEEDAKIIVARDSDYSLYAGRRSVSDRVVYTLGYSIENSLYTQSVIKRIAHILHRKVAPSDADVASWLRSFVDSLRRVITNDLAVSLSGLGIVALSDNCESFMVNNSSPFTSQAKIDARLARIEARVSQEARDRAEAALSDNGGFHDLVLRGHVLASAVLRFVREHSGRKVSHDTLYTTAIALFENNLWNGHEHANHYAAGVDRAVKSLMAA
jgi:hypothetical protein